MSDLQNVNHLLTLAARGKANDGGSGTEKRARKIVLCVLENAAGLDPSASAGIADLIAYVQASPGKCRAAVKRAIR